MNTDLGPVRATRKKKPLKERGENLCDFFQILNFSNYNKLVLVYEAKLYLVNKNSLRKR